MPLKKINAALGLLSIAAMLVHIGYTVFAYLAFYYNPTLKLLTAVPFMVLACLHAICGMLTVFLQSDGTRLDMYPRQNARTVLQRVSAALILPLLILHINTFGLLQSSAEAGQWLWFALLMLSQPLFYGVVLAHIAVSVSRAPSMRAMMLPAPCPNMKPTAWMMLMYPKMTPTAPLWLVPSLPTKAVSTML